MSFKLQQASRQGGRLAEAKLNHPQDTTGNVRGVVNTIVHVMGSLGQLGVQFVLDSGAAVSIVDYRVIERMGLLGLWVPIVFHLMWLVKYFYL